MREFLVTLLVGPAMMIATAVLAALCVSFMPMLPACILEVAGAIALAIALRKRVAGGVLGFAVVAAGLAGAGAAIGFNNLRELRSGEFVRGVALAELPGLLGKDRLTLRDGVSHEELGGSASELVELGPDTPSQRSHTLVSCSAYPIEPQGWTRDSPVTIWRFGDDDPSSDTPLPDRVLHPGAPNELCRKAIDRAIQRRHLVVSVDAIYLEAKVSESADDRMNLYEGPFAVAFLSAIWIIVTAYVFATNAFSARREARR